MAFIKQAAMVVLCAASLALVSSEKDKNKPEKPPVDLSLPRTGMGSDVAANAGLVATALTIKTVGEWGASIKASVCSAGSWVSDTAAAIVSSPATPYVAGGVVGTYVGYKTYRYFRPSQQQREKQADSDRKIAHNERLKEEDAKHTDMLRCQRRRAKSVEGFSACLSKYRRSTSLTSHGFPAECRDEAFTLLLEEDGDTEVTKLAKKFVQFAPMVTSRQK
jgi:hypothetical protein